MTSPAVGLGRFASAPTLRLDIDMKSYPRAKRVADNIRKQMSLLLHKEFADKEFGMVSVTDVELTRDLRQAKVFVSSLSADESQDQLLEYLAEHTKNIRGKLARNISLKFVPELSFAYDSSIVRGMKIESILQEIDNKRSSRENSLDDPS